MALHEAVNLELEQPPGQQDGARDVAAFEFRGLPDIDEQGVRAGALFGIRDGTLPNGRLDSADEISGRDQHRRLLDS